MDRIIDLAAVGIDTAVNSALDELAKPGAVLLLPTETVYGLVCRADDALARQRIYDLKDRDSSKPLGWFIADWRKLDRYGVKITGLPAKLAEKYCPGPITIIAPAFNGKKVGFRVPAYPLVLELLRRIDCPLAQTSANHSGHPNALRVKDALAELTGPLPLAIDGGVLPTNAQASTIVDATGSTPIIVRQGTLKITL